MFDFILAAGATLNINVKLDDEAKADLKAIRETVTKNTALLMTYREAFDSLKESTTQTNKALGEIKGKFTELQGTIEALGKVPEDDAKLVETAKQQSQELDDLVPDPIVVPDPTAGN